MVFDLGLWPLIPYRGSFSVLNLSSNVKKIRKQCTSNNDTSSTIMVLQHWETPSARVWVLDQFDVCLATSSELQNTEVGINKRETNCSPFLIVHLRANAPSLSLCFLHVPTLICLSNPTWWLKHTKKHSSLGYQQYASAAACIQAGAHKHSERNQLKWKSSSNLRVTWVVNNKTNESV